MPSGEAIHGGWRPSRGKELVATLTDEGLPMFNTRLSHTVKIRESHQKAVPLVNLAPSHKVAQEFLSLFQELNGKK